MFSCLADAVNIPPGGRTTWKGTVLGQKKGAVAALNEEQRDVVVEFVWLCARSMGNIRRGSQQQLNALLEAEGTSPEELIACLKQINAELKVSIDTRHGIKRALARLSRRH